MSAAELVDARPEGCWGNAIDPVINAAEQFELARADINEQIDADPSVEVARQEWSRCMAEQGVPFHSPAQVLAHFRSEDQAVRMSGSMGSPVDESGFAALLEEEIRTARIDQFTCNGAELRALRGDIATGLELGAEGQAALELMAADDQ